MRLPGSAPQLPRPMRVSHTRLRKRSRWRGNVAGFTAPSSRSRMCSRGEDLAIPAGPEVTTAQRTQADAGSRFARVVNRLSLAVEVFSAFPKIARPLTMLAELVSVSVPSGAPRIDQGSNCSP